MATYEYQYNVHMAHMVNQWREKTASIAKDRQKLKDATTEEQEQGQSGAKDSGVSKQKLREYLEREEHIWRGTPGPNKLDMTTGRPFVQDRTPSLKGGTDSVTKLGGDPGKVVTEMKVDQNVAEANGTVTESFGNPKDMRQSFTSTQQGRGRWEQARPRYPRHRPQGYNYPSQGYNHHGGYRGDGEDMRPNMQKLGPQRSTGGQFYNKSYPQNWNPKGGFHKGGGGKPDQYLMTMQDSYGGDPFDEDY